MLSMMISTGVFQRGAGANVAPATLRLRTRNLILPRITSVERWRSMRILTSPMPGEVMPNLRKAPTSKPLQMPKKRWN